jgi:di/tricarboxylate transporter
LSTEQIIVFAILAGAMVAFVVGRPRYDVVAAVALFLSVFTGVVPGAEAFAGFGHPAVVTVAAVLIISRALKNAGIVDLLAHTLSGWVDRPRHLTMALTGLCAFVSAFMNNVGALAILLPVALETANKEKISPAEILMPLSFGAILGGLATMIGTPPNVIIATFRAEAMGAPFAMFDFAPVGATVAVVGVVYLVFVGYRFIPSARRGQTPPERLFDIADYMAEVRIGEGSEFAGQTIAAFERAAEDDLTVTARIRGEERLPAPGRRRRLREGDVLLVRGDAQALQSRLAGSGLELADDDDLTAENLSSDEVALIEAVVGHGSPLEGRTQGGIGLRNQGLTLLAAARQTSPVTTRLEAMRFKVGDVLLLQGANDVITDAIARLALLPLRSRDLRLGTRRRIFLALAIFASALGVIAFGWVNPAVALATAVAVFTVLEFISPRELYEAIDWPVIVLLGAMIPVGGALESTGAAALLAGGLVSFAGGHATWLLLAVVLALTMTLSDVMNNAATAVVMAPIAVSIAAGLGASTDAFLMAVAVGASCAFLTPIGHQCNTLVLGPGGYRFGDYWRVGLPLEILIMIVAVPLIMLVWG